MDVSLLVGFKNRIAGLLPGWRKIDRNDSSLRIPLLGEVPPLPEGNKCDHLLMLQLFALGASLSLLPYLGTDGLLKDTLFPVNYRWWVNAVFPTWWLLVCIGVPCTVWGRWPIELMYARLSTHLGMIGITVLVIMFSHWLFALEATNVMGWLLGAAAVFFIVFWLRCCGTGDM